MAVQQQDNSLEIIKDTIIPQFPDEELLKSNNPDPKNTAEGLSAMEAILENRYRGKNVGYKNTTFFENTFLGVGLGYDKFLPSNDELYLEAIPMGHLSFGKKLSPYHTLRLSALIGTGYQNKYARRMYKTDVRLEYLLNLSAFSSGYNPKRGLDIQFLAGAGFLHTKMKQGRSFNSPEFYAGLQFDVFSGPYSRLYVEPILGITMDKIDFSGIENWKRYDVFYGVTIGCNYSLSNNLRYISQEEKQEFNDRAPFFFELANGLVYNTSKDVTMTESLGNETSFSVGKWISSGVGLRITGTYSSSYHNKQQKDGVPTVLNRQVYAAGRVEALINPLGFVRNYNWDSSYGFYLIGGVAGGRLMQSNHKGGNLTTNTESFSAGVQLWKKLRDDLHLFVEPRYTLYNYSLPYSDVNWSVKEKNETFTMNLGLSMTLRAVKYRGYRKDDINSNVDTEKNLIAGVAGGMPILMNKDNTTKGEDGMSFNGLIYGEYLLPNRNSVRLSAEFVSLSRAYVTPYQDQVMQDAYVVSVNKSGLMTHRHNFAIFSATYGVDMLKLATGISSLSKFQLETFFGVGCALHINETATLSNTVTIKNGHRAVANNMTSTTPYLCFTAGAKTVYNVTSKLGIVLTPTLYYINNLKLNTFSFPKVVNSLVETINVGVQYRFNFK